MGDITRKIELFNKAYAAALSLTKEQPERKPPTPVHLAALIRSKIAAGATDAEIIAAEAVRAGFE